MNKRGANAVSTLVATVLLATLAIAAVGTVYPIFDKFIRDQIKAAEISQAGIPPLTASAFPGQGQVGTVFKINVALATEEETSWINAEISSSGKIIKSIPLYDDGNHGDSGIGDGIYSNTFDSSGNEEGIYDIKIVAFISGQQMEYGKATSFKIFRENCIPLIYNGNPDDKIDVTIVPYGYEDLEEFKEDAMSVASNGILTYEPFKSNKGKLNFYIVNQKSSFSCRRDENSRTIVYCDDTEVEKMASQCPADQIIVLLNDAEFCGTASFYARACNGWNLEQVATHEFGHTFGGLGDEYTYSVVNPQYRLIAFSFPNCDTENCGKWQNSAGTGCFSGCGISELFRPTQENCIMKKYVDMFCPVCNAHIQALLENYQLGEAVIQAAPPLEKTYVIDLNYDSGNLTLANVYATQSKAPDRKTVIRTDYTARLISFEGKEIYSFNFTAPNILFPAPPINGEAAIPPIVLDKTSWALLAPQNDSAEKLEVFANQKMLFSADVGYLSNTCGNGICEKHESASDCSADCKGEVKDGICNSEKNKVCDADCPDIDPDCSKTSWAIVLSSFLMMAIAIFLVIKYILMAPKEEY